MIAIVYGVPKVTLCHVLTNLKLFFWQN